MTPEEIIRFEKLEANLKAVTDSLAVLDAVLKSERIGEPKTMAFRCTHSGLYFPEDYAKQWGLTTGIGLGPEVVSECLDSMYHIAPQVDRIRHADDIMHPVQVCFAQVDLVVVPAQEFDARSLILARDDEDMRKRVTIVRRNQLRRPGSQVAAYHAEFARILKGVK